MAKNPPKVLTDTFLKSVKTDKPQQDYFDAGCTGLSIRVTKAGKKTWSFYYTSPRDGDRARSSIGTYPGTMLEPARTRAKALRTLVEAGTDPRDVQPEEAAKTMADLIEDRLAMEVRAEINPETGKVIREALRTADEIERRFTVNVLPIVGTIAVKAFRITDLNKVIDPIKKRGAKRMAGQTYTDLTTLFDFAVGRGEYGITHNPIAQVKVDKGWETRKRNLNLEEIKIVWGLLPTALAKSPHIPTILKLCLATGQRLSEVAGMPRSELNLQKRVWVIDKTRVKNEHDHAVPLNDLALQLIGEAMRKTGGEFLFPGRSGKVAITHRVVDKAVLKAHASREGLPLGKFGIAQWKPHDLRRTLGTQVLAKGNGLYADGELLLMKFKKHLVLNHRSATKGNVGDEVYDMNEYLEEKRDLLDKWGAFLANLVGEETGLRAVA